MPSIGAAVAASVVGWVIDDLLQPFLGTGVTLVIAFAVSTFVFYFARKWLIDLRGR